MEITIISTFDVDVDKIVSQLSDTTKAAPKSETEQQIRQSLLSAFEEAIKIGFQHNQFIRPVFSILDESEEKKL